MNVADRFAGDAGSQTNPLSKHFDESVKSLMQVTERYVDLFPDLVT
jgi:importin subunit beta-1